MCIALGITVGMAAGLASHRRPSSSPNAISMHQTVQATHTSASPWRMLPHAAHHARPSSLRPTVALRGQRGYDTVPADAPTQVSWQTPRLSPVTSAGGAVAAAFGLLLLLLRRRSAPEPLAMLSVTADPSAAPPLPQTPVEMAQQAAAAVDRALADGLSRQTIKMLLPINQREYDFMATETADFPCSIQTEYKAAGALTRTLLEGLAAVPEGSVVETKIGTEGDPAGVFKDPQAQVSAVTFPAAEKLDTLRTLDRGRGAQGLLIVNPQWNVTKGNVVSDFGFGPWRRAAEDFLARFAPTYSLEEYRVGSPGTLNPVTMEAGGGTGGVVRVLRCYPGDWHVYLVGQAGGTIPLGSFTSEPTYQQLGDAIAAYVARGGSTIPSKVAKAAAAGQEQEGGAREGAESDRLTASQVDALDKKTIRLCLSRLGLPTSGKLDTLKQRLKDALEQEAP